MLSSATVAQTHTLRVETSGSGAGTVHDCRAAAECPGEHISCGSQCLAVYAAGESVLLRARPDAASIFEGWIVNGEPPLSIDIQMTQEVVVTAIFTRCAPLAKTLTVAFLEGVNLAEGVTERDATFLSLGVGVNLNAVTDIILPNLPNLFDFTEAVTFHFAYGNGPVHRCVGSDGRADGGRGRRDWRSDV